MTESQPASCNRSKRPILGVVLLVAVLTIGNSACRIQQATRNAYAVWWMADMVVEHLKSSDRQWPQSWDDLRDDYETCVERSGRPWSFDELTERTQVEWRVDPADLLAQSAGHETAPFRVITLIDGTESHWQGRERNQIILDHLRSEVPKP